ncbi:o-succinylbenzoate synthase [Leifsonia sp. TF02-11]|uniref:o-succinylbenzoate synthase n=1 Tax=Leifsonia sp. TF02-11 TaxID=2815212 RepID=UPI001AA1986C|nr:o-succinylbenzoate synthase [Leifsonia sp. TF02-11]MBO1737600.1 o-succinylbenzoate synthase [Leifsonia sp. TF02-11]
MLAHLDELLGTACVVQLPMRTRFRGITLREAVLFEGPEGWTEFSPFVEYDDEEASAWLHAAIDFGWRAQPTPLRELIPVNATVPAVAAEAVATVLDRYPGARTAKVKVAEPGQTLADDVARVRAVRDRLGPEGRIRIDANALWNVDEAEHAIHALAPFDLEYVEQPCATVEELAEIRARTRYMDIPVAADESVRKASDPLAVARAGAADLLVIKAQPLGGVHAALRIVAEAGLPVVVSSALDTSIGIAMGARLAAAVSELDFDCGLGTVAMFEEDVAVDPLVPVEGAIRVERPEVSATQLGRLSAPADRRDWWLERVRRCYRLVERATAL